MPSVVDLHMHSQYSDGTDSAQELAARMERDGIGLFALTDHDTASGLLPTAQAARAVPSLRFFPGVEFSCRTAEGKCHILGYFPDIAHPALKTLLDAVNALRLQKLQLRLDFLREHFGVTMEDDELAWLRSIPSPGKPHLARLLMRRGLAATVTEAIDNYLVHCPSGDTRLDAAITVPGILAAGGIPVWAHPTGGLGEPEITIDEFEQQLLTLRRLGIEGLECWYSLFPVEKCRRLAYAAGRDGLLISGGSDYHGKNKSVHPGMLNAEDEPVPPEELTLLSRLL